jgi:hypothetical protein
MGVLIFSARRFDGPSFRTIDHCVARLVTGVYVLLTFFVQEQRTDWRDYLWRLKLLEAFHGDHVAWSRMIENASRAKSFWWRFSLIWHRVKTRAKSKTAMEFASSHLNQQVAIYRI